MKNRKNKWYNLGQGCGLVYILCHALAVCIGIILILIGQSIAVAVGTGIMATGICGFVTIGLTIYCDNLFEKKCSNRFSHKV